jgi:two-component sensor histidine kinase
MPENFVFLKSKSLGMSLIDGLSADLNGKFLLENCRGTTLRVRFKKDAILEKSKTA